MTVAHVRFALYRNTSLLCLAPPLVSNPSFAISPKHHLQKAIKAVVFPGIIIFTTPKLVRPVERLYFLLYFRQHPHDLPLIEIVA